MFSLQVDVNGFINWSYFFNLYTDQNFKFYLIVIIIFHFKNFQLKDEEIIKLTSSHNNVDGLIQT